MILLQSVICKEAAVTLSWLHIWKMKLILAVGSEACAIMLQDSNTITS
jgi:hypothetical protein